MRLITGSMFNFLTIPTLYNFVLGQISIEKVRMTNDQELPKIINIR